MTPPDAPALAAPAASTPTGVARVRAGLLKPSNWLQLVHFGAVGASGFVVNTAVYAVCLHVLDLQYILCAVLAFCVAVTNNFIWNRGWTFRRTRSDGGIGTQGARFLLVSVSALLPNLGFLALFVQLGLDELPAQMLAVCLVMPLSFLGNKLWTFD
jgi:putative flippase GtrA